MPLQNRVDPWGELQAVSAKGTMLGNRGGKFHRDDKTLSKRRWASKHWICCELHYKNWRHEPMGDGYTSLFFLDEVTALAAGHRPCFMCRNAEAKAFLDGEPAHDFDDRVHEERLAKTQWDGDLPDGAMIEIDGEAYALKDGRLLHWTFDGYDRSAAMQRAKRILTPPSIIAILARGYKPRWHLSIKKHEAS